MKKLIFVASILVVLAGCTTEVGDDSSNYEESTTTEQTTPSTTSAPTEEPTEPTVENPTEEPTEETPSVTEEPTEETPTATEEPSTETPVVVEEPTEPTGETPVVTEEPTEEPSEPVVETPTVIEEPTPTTPEPSTPVVSGTDYWIHTYSSTIDFTDYYPIYFVSEGNGYYQLWMNFADKYIPNEVLYESLRFNSAVSKSENVFKLLDNGTEVGRVSMYDGSITIDAPNRSYPIHDKVSELAYDLARVGVLWGDNTSVPTSTSTNSSDLPSNLNIVRAKGFDVVGLESYVDVTFIVEDNGFFQIIEGDFFCRFTSANISKHGNTYMVNAEQHEESGCTFYVGEVETYRDGDRVFMPYSEDKNVRFESSDVESILTSMGMLD